MTDHRQFASRVLFEDNHLLVVNKQSGLVTQGALEESDSLLELAKQYLKHKYNKPGNVFLGVVSRLDRLVSGVLVFARTSKAAKRLNEQFRDRLVEKRYWALVAHKPQPNCGQLVHHLRKNESRKRMEVCSSKARHAAEARLNYQLVKQLSQACLLEIELETGRKHQIRIQLEAAGMPILGDNRYGSKRSFPEGIALHSRSLTFAHPTSKESMTFEAVLPKSWAGFGV